MRQHAKARDVLQLVLCTYILILVGVQTFVTEVFESRPIPVQKQCN